MHIDIITKAVAAAVLGLAVASPVTAGAQSRDDGAGTFAGIYIYSALKNGQPLAFCNHDIDYETLYPENGVDPINFECRILGPHKRGSYQRATVIPSVIRVGMYAMHPIEMSSGAFQQTGIKSVQVRAEIRTIPQSAFMFCADLETVEFCGDAPHFIEASAFRSCTKLRSVTGLPARLRYIGDQAFSQCMSLEDIYIPKDVEYLGEEAFSHCNSLAKVTFATGHFRHIPKECFYGCEQLKEVTIPEGVSSLGINSFYYSGLEKITLPSTMRALYDGCLSQTPLKDIYLHATTPPGVGKVFTGHMIKNIRLHVPASAIAAYRADRFWGLFTHILPL